MRISAHDPPPTLRLLLLALLVASSGYAHLRGADAESGANQATTQESSQNPIRVETNDVVTPITVRDKTGEFVLNLSAKDFHIFDDGVEQPIDQFSLGGDPLAVALVVQTNSHVQLLMPSIHKLSVVFTETVMAIGGEASLISYGDQVDIRQEFTRDHDAIQKSIASLTADGSNMRLYDAMERANTALEHQPTELHRVILVIGESHDLGSQATLGETVREAEFNDISIYVVGISSTSIDVRSGIVAPPIVLHKHAPPITAEKGYTYADYMTPALWLLTRGINKVSSHELEVAAAATGGFHYSAGSDRAIPNALYDIGSELHAQYLVTYTAPPKAVDGFHRIRVTVNRPGTSVRSRPGYYHLTAEAPAK